MSEETPKDAAAPAGGETPAASAPAEQGGVAVQAPELPEVQGGPASNTPSGLGLEHLFDISLGVTIKLGSTTLPIETLVKLGPGSVITLDQLTTDPVEVFVNGKLVAKGEVVTIGDSYGVRVTGILEPEDRLKAIG